MFVVCAIVAGQLSAWSTGEEPRRMAWLLLNFAMFYVGAMLVAILAVATVQAIREIRRRIRERDNERDKLNRN